MGDLMAARLEIVPACTDPHAEVAPSIDCDGTVYLTGVSNPASRALKRPDLGLLATPQGGTGAQRAAYWFWAADNGCYGENRPGGTPLDVTKWLGWLDRLTPTGCLFATLPDVLNWLPYGPDGQLVPVGDAVATWHRSAPYVDTVRALGFPVAVVLQDGIEDRLDLFDEILDAADAVFVGGSDDWKLSDTVEDLLGQAADRGLWTHVGRVNSRRRLFRCQAMGADSADGTFLGFGRPNVDRLTGWLDELRLAGA